MAIDGLGTVVPFASPAAGANFSTSVPAGKIWRFSGLSARYTASATVAQRSPQAVLRKDGVVVHVGGCSTPITASQVWKLVCYKMDIYMAGTFYSTWVPLSFPKGVWLPETTVISLEAIGIQTGDQIDQVVGLYEEQNA